MNSYGVKVLLDSVSPDGGRLTTMEVSFPRFILAEFNTHRVFSRNAASSRAIPVARRVEAVRANPFTPNPGYNKRGMQAAGELRPDEQEAFEREWLALRDAACAFAEKHSSVHKQWVNRALEPWSWVTVIVSSTEWENFFQQRCHPDAQPEFRRTAEMMRVALGLSVPGTVKYGEWHRPYINREDVATVPDHLLNLVSVGRCARVSYLGHNGTRDPEEDIALANRLLQAKPPHASPLEHVATPAANRATVKGNFAGWHQLRHYRG